MDIKDLRLDYRAHSLLDINEKWLEDREFDLMMLDADNTCMLKGARFPSGEIGLHLVRLKRKINICIVSNRPYAGQLKMMCSYYAFSYVVPGLRYRRWKPQPWCLQEAMRRHNVSPGKTLMVGDQLTDIIAANRAGCYSLLVDPLDPKKGYHWATKKFKLPKQEQYFKALTEANRMPDYISSASEPP